MPKPIIEEESAPFPHIKETEFGRVYSMEDVASSHHAADPQNRWDRHEITSPIWPIITGP